VSSVLVWYMGTPKPKSSASTDRAPVELTPPAPPLARIPPEQQPNEGWPTLLLLHGRGSSAERMLELAEVIRDGGMAVAIPTAPVLMGERRYEWPTDWEAMNAYMERTLTDATTLGGWKANRARLYIGGFSQGAGLALVLAARRPDFYRGVLAISPVSATRPQTTGAPQSSAFIMAGLDDEAALEPARQTAESWRSSGWPVVLETFPGGHQPPTDWAPRVESATRWLLTGRTTRP
jgi:phospholipase/carboxylesterase